MSVRLGVLAVAALASSCTQTGPTSERSETFRAHLPPGTAALVGETAIPSTLVAAVSHAERVAPSLARDRLIADALAAAGARASGNDGDARTAWALETITARAVAEHVRAAARAAGPPTDSEIADLSREHWREVDLPEQARVIHAVLVRPGDPAPPAARALATQLVAVLSTANSAEDFEARARSISPGPFDLRVERLPPFVEDGRIAEGAPGAFDPAFARAAFLLKKPGDTSGVVESGSGLHVIRLLERLPPKVLSPEARRARFADEAFKRRARAEIARILTLRAEAAPIQIASAAEALMATVAPGPEP